MSDGAEIFTFFFLGSIGMGIVFGITASCGIITQIIGNAILLRIGSEGYASRSLAVNVGFLGGCEGFVFPMILAAGGIVYIDIIKLAPILTLPFLVVGGVITGASGIGIMRHQWRWDELGSYGYPEATRAGALGSAVFWGAILVPLTLGIWIWFGYNAIFVSVKKRRARSHTVRNEKSGV